jgi:hypothetical protein
MRQAPGSSPTHCWWCRVLAGFACVAMHLDNSNSSMGEADNASLIAETARDSQPWELDDVPHQLARCLQAIHTMWMQYRILNKTAARARALDGFERLKVPALQFTKYLNCTNVRHLKKAIEVCISVSSFYGSAFLLPCNCCRFFNPGTCDHMSVHASAVLQYMLQ